MAEEYGGFTARATVGGAYPVEGALVRILGAEENNRDIAYAVLTDRDGLTPKIALPAPKRSLSLSPNQPEAPYYIYDVEVSANGYFDKRLYGVTVFSGSDSLLEVNMIPRGTSGNDIPEGNLDAEIR